MTTPLLQSTGYGSTVEVRRWRRILRSRFTAVAAIWLATALISIFAPDMITGSQHEHLPIASFTVWVWALAASGYVLMSGRQGPRQGGLVVGVSAIWLAVLVAVVGSPVMVTGTDPTRIPVAVFVAPVLGALATGYVAIFHSTQGPVSKV